MVDHSTFKPSYRYGPWSLLVFAAAAVIIGIIVRFNGLSTWPFAADEYYSAKSVENVLRFGLPAYECGGYYVRGVLIQYLAAGLQLSGVSAELAPRVIAATTNLLALPAVFLLGRRLYGNTAGLLAVALVAISVWEVEIARFGRMYAPFQTVFLWYLVYFFRYTVDRRQHAVWGMVALSIVGVLVWEGGVLLAVANLLPPFLNHTQGRLNMAQCRFVGWMALLLLPIYGFAMYDFRWLGDVSPLPPDYDALVSAARPLASAIVQPIWMTLPGHPLWLVAALLPLAAAGIALPWIMQFRDRWLLVAGLIVVVAAALLHQFLVVIATLALLLLFRLLHWRELLCRPALRLPVAILAAAVFWTAAGLATHTWQGDQASGSTSIIVALGYQFFGFPDFLEMIARSWARAVPVLGISLLVLTAAAAVRIIFQKDAAPSAEQSAGRVLLVVAIIMVLLTSAGDAPRTTTRYSFFLYPVLLIIAVGTLIHAVEIFTRHRRIAGRLAVAVVLGWYALTEDFQPNHLRNIDTAEINFRHNMPPGIRSHYIGRTDRRAVADWLAAHADPSTDLIISGNGVNGLDYYYPHFDFVYVDPRDRRLGAWACRQGTVERWTNLPLVYSMSTLQSRIAASPRSYIVIDGRRLGLLWPDVEHLHPTVVWENVYGFEVIIQFRPAQSKVRTEPDAGTAYVNPDKDLDVQG